MNYNNYVKKLLTSITITVIITFALFGTGESAISVLYTGMIYSCLYTTAFFIVEYKVAESFKPNAKWVVFIKLSSTGFVTTLVGQWITITVKLVPFSSFVLVLLIAVTVIILPTVTGIKILSQKKHVISDKTDHSSGKHSEAHSAN